MKWKPFTHKGEIFDLSHLHDTSLTVVQPAKDDKPEVVYDLQVTFGLHCFTSGLKDGEKLDLELKYCDSRECRHFDKQRYELSKQLPAIIAALRQKKCFHSGKGNFFLVELMGISGTRQQYEVYFAVSKASGGNGKLNLFVQSAYIRTQGQQPQKKPIGFCILLHNVKNSKPIRVPQ